MLDADSVLWRVHFRGVRHPVVWNQLRSHGPVASGRFDHHEPPPRSEEWSILYAASEGSTCLAEVLQDTRVADRQRNEPWIAAFALEAPLALRDLTGSWPTRAGASMAIHTGPGPRTQRWARAIYAAYPAVQGILYSSSMHANRPALALFEKALPALPAQPRLNRVLAEPPISIPIANAAARLGYRVV